MKAVLVPVKDPANAKRRLASLLSARERSKLAWTMLKEVGSALAASREPDRIVVVARDRAVLRYAIAQGWDIIAESEQVSQACSVDRATDLLGQQGFEAVLCVAGDIPLLQAEDVDCLLRMELASPQAVLVPSRDGRGTNGLLRVPPSAIRARFGAGSLVLHKKEADSTGVRLVVVQNSRMALDLDEAADLLCLWELDRSTSTSQLISEMGLIQRLEERGA